MDRRRFLQSGAAAVAAAAAGCSSTGDPLTALFSELPGTTVTAYANAAPGGDVYIPGYMPKDAYFEGVRAFEHRRLMRAVPKDYDGSVRLLTRLGMDGDVAQALFPVYGHDVGISPDGRTGFFGNLEERSYVTFDPKSLDLIALGSPVAEGWIGGGHGVFIDGGAVLALSERAPKVGYLGRPDRHFGRITLREPDTLKVLESYSTHGVSPHDIRLLADGEHMAIANYGSVVPQGRDDYGIPLKIVEPSVTVINLRSGKLEAKYASRSRDMEIRHLCAHDLDTIYAIQTELDTGGKDQRYFKKNGSAYEAELTGGDFYSYLSAPTVRALRGSGRLEPIGTRKLRELMRHGLSIHYEPRHDEVIATYPATHSVMVFDAPSGEVKQRIDCASIGLDYPCGIVPLKDPRYYVVAGYWKNLFVFERGSHRLMRELCHYTTFFGHSHITAA